MFFPWSESDKNCDHTNTMSSNNELVHARGVGHVPQRRASPQPKQQMQRSRQNHDGRRSDNSNRLSAGARPFQPTPRSQGAKRNDDLEELEKAELAKAVLASFSVKRPVPEGPFDRSSYDLRQNRNRIDSRFRNDSRRGSNGKKSLWRGPADLALNRFQFILSPASCYCDKPLQTLLAMSSAELWPHVVAVVASDYDPLCSICLDGISAGRALPCGHIFCAVCIHRCLEAAERDPLLQKCPVCTEGELSRAQLRRCQTKSEQSNPHSYTLIQSISGENVPPLLLEGEMNPSRIAVACGEGMLRVIDTERNQIAQSRQDMSRFRDVEGIRILKDVESDLDKSQIEWQRHVGKARARNAFAASATASDTQIEWAYQRSDGALEFLHPLNFKCLLKHYDGDVFMLPKIVCPKKILEVEEWADKKFNSAIKLGSMHIPDNPMSIRIVEVELEGMSEEALRLVEKESSDRARRREDRDSRKLKQQLKEMQEQATTEERNRATREKEESLLRAFFGYEERKAAEELKEVQERPQPAINSFSAVVSSMGHFPALGKSPSLEPSKPPSEKAWGGSPTLEPLRGAWATTSSPQSQSSFTLSSSPSTESSFAQVTVQGPGKKVLWSNNPARRGQW